MADIQQNIYLQRVNMVLDYVTTHIDGDLSLKTLARVAGFSDFHFHRIFKSVTGETLNQFVWRVRVERGAALLRADTHITVSDAAFRCGFTSLAGFSRAFKGRFGISPTKWDRQTKLEDERRVLNEHFPTYHISQLQDSSDQFDVQVRRLEAQKLAYIRVYDSYQVDGRISEAYDRLLTWYLACGGRLEDTTLYGMSMDDRDITPETRCCFDWCVQIPDCWEGNDIVSTRELPACLIATITMDGGDLRLEDRIWQYFWRYWLPHSPYKPVSLPAMEIYHRFPRYLDRQANGWWDKYYLDCAVPVAHLSEPKWR